MVAAPRGAANLADLGEIEGERLLAEHVIAALERFEHGRRVAPRRRGDVDEVELGLGLGGRREIGVDPQARNRGERLGALFLGGLDDGRDLEARRLPEAGQVGFGGDLAEADDRASVLLHR